MVKKSLGIEFEMRHGNIALLKTGYSALSRLLVQKGIVTEEELVKAFEREVEQYEADITNENTSEYKLEKILQLCFPVDNARIKNAKKILIEIVGIISRAD